MPAVTLETHLRALRLPRARLRPADLPLMLPSLADDVPPGAGWVFEVKWDGVRVLALRVDGRVRLYARSQADVTARYAEIAAAVDPLEGGDLALDAEIVALDESGRPSFHRLQRRMHVERGLATVAVSVPVVAYAYDCLSLHGLDVRGLPLVARKQLLEAVVPRGGPLRYAEHVEADGGAFLAAACAEGLEGVVAKRADAPYRGGRRTEWRKVKCHCRQEFVIGGFTEPKGTRAHLGALHLGVYDGRDLVYAGRVGSGLDADDLHDLERRLRALAVAESPFARGAVPSGREHHWVRPALVCEVRFSEWTPDGSLRHPIYLGLRADRRPETVRRETTPGGGAR